MTDPSKSILLVEDDKNDAFFLQYAFEAAGVPNPLVFIDDGQKAIDYLSGVAPYNDRAKFPFPCLVLLDLKLPGKEGLEVLRWLQSQPALRNLLVIVLTSSSDVSDVDKAYRLGARSYLVKPLTVEKRLAMAQALKSYWLDLNEFPTLGGCTTAEPSNSVASVGSRSASTPPS
jgi:CheY-like chemotaxis protein